MYSEENVEESHCPLSGSICHPTPMPGHYAAIDRHGVLRSQLPMREAYSQQACSVQNRLHQYFAG